LKSSLGLKGRIVAVLTKDDGSKRVLHATNIVTTAGDVWFAQSAAGESPTNAFDSLHWGEGVVAPGKSSDADDLTAISGSGKAVSASYPMTDDPDADNTDSGPNVLTWKFSYAKTDGPWTGIVEGCIAIGAGALGAAEPLLSHFQIAEFDKSTDESLVVYYNVELVGA
jgi:hypothetical protein